MLFRVLAVAGAATILAIPTSTSAQVLMQRELSARMALTIAETAWTECTARVSVAVVDRAGRMKALSARISMAEAFEVEKTTVPVLSKACAPDGSTCIVTPLLAGR